MDIVETRITVDQLRLGMRVTRLDRDWLETEFLLQGFTIRHSDELRSLQETCDFVYVEGIIEIELQPGRRQPGQLKPAQRVRYISKIAVEAELPNASRHYQDARALARNLLEGVRLGRVLDIEQARKVVDGCVDSVLRNDQALRMLMQIKHKDAYTAEHSLNVCILSAIFGRHLGLVRGEIEQLALGAMLHDLGKVRVPDAVLNKPGAFTPEEAAIMREHPSLGRNLLMSVTGAPASAVDIAYSHHERVDGGGYPRALKAAQIPYFAKIVALVDCYDAITSNRCYGVGRSSKTALDIIYRERDKHFDEDLALAFIQCIGVYPPGSVVELANGEVGIVIATNRGKKLRPRLLIVRDADKNVCREKIVDLMHLNTDASGQTYVIVRELANGVYGVDLATFVEKGLRLGSALQPEADAPIDLELIHSWFTPAEPALD